jgi:hypothetical protein
MPPYFVNGEVLDESYFINKAEQSVDPTDDEGKVVKLEADGKFHPDFLPFEEAIVVVPFGIGSSSFGTNDVDSPTVAQAGLVFVPSNITVAKLSLRIGTVTVAGTLDISLYTEDGQTKLFTVTTPTVAAQTIVTVTLGAPVSLTPGNYYILINSNASVNFQVYTYTTPTPFSVANTNLNGDISGEPKLGGTLTITSGTPPTTFNPSSLTAANSKALVVRFDS